MVVTVVCGLGLQRVNKSRSTLELMDIWRAVHKMLFSGHSFSGRD